MWTTNQVSATDADGMVSEPQASASKKAAKTRQDPGWYELMLDVGASQGWPREKFDAVFFEGVSKYPYYSPLYFTRMSYYSPRWYGSVEEGKRVADDAVERTRSRWGEIMYARLNWAMMDIRMFKTGQADGPNENRLRADAGRGMATFRRLDPAQELSREVNACATASTLKE